VFGPEWAGILEELRKNRSSGEKGDERLEREVSRCLSRLSG
jgi:precorrin-2 dehydrogenase / sirohydrochlorin ferrochelatase